MRWIRGALLAAALAGGGTAPSLLVASPAGALSCQPVDGATPEAIAGGTFANDDGSGFFDHYDFAVIGTVTAIRTDERQGSPTYGATELDVVVDGVLGVDGAPETMTLSAADPGWMAGYPFERGASYFVPVQARSAEGKVNWTFACDPITPLADPAATARELQGVADGAGLAFGTPGDPGPPSRGGGDPNDDATGWFAPTVTVVAVLTAAATATAVIRRRTPAVAPR